VLLPDNPVLPGTYPDPSICRVGDEYFLVTSTFEYFPGLPVFRSTDLLRWEQVGHALDRRDQLDLSTVPSSGGLFAPTIRHYDGTFYLVCTLVGGEGRRGNFILTATDAAGPWSAPTWLADAEGIDPSLYFDARTGRCWYTGTRLSPSPDWPEQTEVWLRELDLASMALIGDEHIIWNGALIGAVWAEGPHLYRRGEHYYLLASEGGTEFNHAISVARATAITGPYAGSPANPVLTHRNMGHRHPVANVGHADLVETADGEWAAVLLASRPYGGYHANLGRETFAVAVEWEDDWPVFAPGVGQLVLGRVVTEPAGPPPTLAWTQVRAGAQFWNGDPATGSVSLSAAGSLADGGTPAFLGVRQRHRDVVFTATAAVASSSSSPRHSRADAAGLAVRQSEADHILCVVTSGTAVVTVVRAGVADVAATVAIPPGPVALELRTAGQDYAFLANGEPLATVDGRFLSSQAAGGFLGVWLGLYAVGGAADFSGISYAGD
jgi:alpha-N-arabinofuranosidase